MTDPLDRLRALLEAAASEPGVFRVYDLVETPDTSVEGVVAVEPGGAVMCTDGARWDPRVLKLLHRPIPALNAVAPKLLAVVEAARLMCEQPCIASGVAWERHHKAARSLEALDAAISAHLPAECLGSPKCCADPDGVLSTSHHPDCPKSHLPADAGATETEER